MGLFGKGSQSYSITDLNMLMESFVQQYEAGNMVETPQIERLYHKIMSHRELTNHGTVIYRGWYIDR